MPDLSRTATHCPKKEQSPCSRSRRSLLLATALSWPLAAFSTTPPYPDRPIKLIVPWPAGGATDLTLRVLAEEAQPLLGQPVVIMNRPGAGGTLVAPMLKAAAADGYTIGQVPLTVYRHVLMNSVNWDPVTDLSPILQVSGTTFGVLVPADSPFRSFADVVAWGRQHPGRLVVGSTGIGTTAHLAIEEIFLQHGIDYVHVPYRGTADHMLALANGQLMVSVNSTGFAPWVEQGKVRVLATFDEQRSPRWPEAPTLRELGYADSVYTSPWGLCAPAGTPASCIRVLHDAFAKAMFSPRHQRELERYDQALAYLDTESYRSAVLATMQREQRLLQRLRLAGGRTEVVR